MTLGMGGGIASSRVCRSAPWHLEKYCPKSSTSLPKPLSKLFYRAGLLFKASEMVGPSLACHLLHQAKHIGTPGVRTAKRGSHFRQFPCRQTCRHALSGFLREGSACMALPVSPSHGACLKTCGIFSFRRKLFFKGSVLAYDAIWAKATAS